MKNILLLHFDFLSKLGGQKVGSSQMHTTGHFVVDFYFDIATFAWTGFIQNILTNVF